ncbi:cation transporter [Nakamurella sp. DB0629]|uniref:Cation transporter n=1 Tax=Nakamurella aerolata TaxID=1656892 RepID=A0A849A7X2_9ACTN|nr:cation diffusion facilitator family transporter [Nakamurella aerolata]NNG35706.1 cation transporter [Nakamurella aerolata]
MRKNPAGPADSDSHSDSQTHSPKGEKGGSSHGHSHGFSAAGKHRWRLAVAFSITASFFVVELIVGLISGSLALLSDAGHMAADVVALGAALVATSIATRPDRSGRRTYGSYRAEVFASGLAVLLMLGVSVYIAIEAIARIGEKVEVGSGAMMLVGALGLLVNLIAIVLLSAGSKESLNLKGAYLEVMADTLGSVGVIVAGVLVQSTGQSWWDTVIALAIAVFVAVRAIILGRQVLAVLGQHAPEGIQPEAVVEQLRTVDGVEQVHDLHLWALTSGMNVATAHLVTSKDADPTQVLAGARQVMLDKFEIDHATLQVEPTGSGHCGEINW